MSKAVINIKVINQDRDSVKRQLSLSGQSEFNAKANHISFSDHPGDSTNSGGTLGSCLASIYLLKVLTRVNTGGGDTFILIDSDRGGFR